MFEKLFGKLAPKNKNNERFSLPDFDDEAVEKVGEALETSHNSFSAKMVIQRVVPGADEARIGALMWEAFRRGLADPAADVSYASYLAQAPPEAYRPGDLLAFIARLAHHYPGGEKAGVAAWSDRGIPGAFYGLDALLDQQAGRAEFFEALAEKVDELPAPWDEGLRHALARRGAIELDALPDDAAAELALRRLRQPSQDRLFAMSDVPWPPDVWARSVARAVLDHDLRLDHAGALENLQPYVSPEELIALAKKVDFEIGDARVGAVAFEAAGEPMIAPLEEALAELQIGPVDLSRPWPALLLVPGYLRLCLAQGHTPPAPLDVAFYRFLEHYRAPGFQPTRRGYHAFVRGALEALPEDRLAELFESTSQINIHLVGPAQSSRILERLVGRLVELPEKTELNVWDAFREILLPYGAQAAARLTEALRADTFPHRKIALQILARIDDPSAVPGLVEGLKDRTKSVRQIAQKALLARPPEALLGALPEALHASRKAMRMAAAEVLASLPVSRRRFKLAQERLDVERTSDVREILEAIQPPPEATIADLEAAEAAIAAGEAPSEHTDASGADLVRLLVDELRGKRAAWFQSSSSIDRIVALVEAFDSDGHAVAAAVGAVVHVNPEIRRRAPRQFIERLHERLPGVPAALAALAGTGRLEDAGESMSWRAFNDEKAIKWVLDHLEADVAESLVALLNDRRKSIVNLAVEGLEEIGEAAAEPIWTLLLSGDAKADAREACAQLLEDFGVPEAAPRLEEVIEGERSGRVREALESALIACTNAAFDVADYDSDAELDAALADQQAERPQLAPCGLPDLHWKQSGEPLSTGATRWFLRELFREGPDTHSEQLARVRNRIDDLDIYALCDALLEEAPRRYEGWGLYIQAILAAPRHIDDLAAELPSLAASAATHWGADGVEVLARHGSKRAIQSLDRARTSRKRALRRRARKALKRMAEARQMSVDALLMLAAPDFGFDMTGQQVLDYGPRQIIARLDPENGVVFIDEKGKVRKSLPRARKSDDEAKVAAIKERLKGLKRRLKRITRAQTERLEDAMASGRIWDVEQWRTRLLEHPVTFTLVLGLVFEHMGSQNFLFAIAEEGVPIDVDGEDVDLLPGARIRLVHPIEADDATLEAWHEHLSMRELTPPFDQLGRAVYLPEDYEQLPRDVLRRLPHVDPRSFMGRLRKLGYEEGARMDGGRIYDARRELGAYEIHIDHTGYAPELFDLIDEVEIRRVRFSESDKPLDWKKLPPRLLSEVVRELKELTRESQ